MDVSAINIVFDIPPERPTPEFPAKLESGAPIRAQSSITTPRTAAVSRSLRSGLALPGEGHQNWL
jgi:hypothetical protein